jgi:hypothetical protein
LEKVACPMVAPIRIKHVARTMPHWFVSYQPPNTRMSFIAPSRP